MNILFMNAMIIFIKLKNHKFKFPVKITAFTENFFMILIIIYLLI